ncbi:MAG TPA: Gfo/Idh/MocA family oxidoreductase [Acidobacteriaceae bacterium]|nr:Gfo/Idh/MocA family oxidoreductase [Acidobacteriaceae bacterium]
MSVLGPLSRRDFLRAGSGAAVGGYLAARTIDLAAEAQIAAPASGDVVRFGIIGVGTEGSALLRTAVALPGVKCVAASDLYDGRHTLAKQIAGQDVRTTRRYHEVLDDKSIQCVFVATPDFWHKQVVVDALAAGKDVYCEKPMSHSLVEGADMVEAVRNSGGKFVQVGSQRVSSALFAKAKELVSSGAIGDLMQVELQLGRNSPDGAWEYPPPLDLSPENLDWITWQKDVPKKPFNPYIFARWRCWHQYGTGMAGDLMVHLVSGMQFATGINASPDWATTIGGIFRWKDGRNMPDVQDTLLQYGRTPVSVRLTLTTETPETTRILGSKGVVEVANNSVTWIPQLGIDTSSSYYSQSFPAAMRAEYDREWHEKNDPILARHPLADVTVYRGPSWDDLRPHVANFFNAVRTRKPVVEDAVFGQHAAAACHMANASYFEGKTVRS